MRTGGADRQGGTKFRKLGCIRMVHFVGLFKWRRYSSEEKIPARHPPVVQLGCKAIHGTGVLASTSTPVLRMPITDVLSLGRLKGLVMMLVVFSAMLTMKEVLPSC